MISALPQIIPRLHHEDKPVNEINNRYLFSESQENPKYSVWRKEQLWILKELLHKTYHSA